MKLDELTHDLGLSQHLCDPQDQISSCHTFIETTAEANADNIWSENVNGLTEHCGLCFNAAHSPTNDSEAIDHRRMGVRAHKRVRKINRVFLPNALRQEFKIHLVTNANAGRDHIKSVECLSSPLQELI